MGQQEASKSEQPANLLAGIMGIGRNALGLFLNRVELAALELSEVRTALLKLAVVFGLALTAVWFAAAYWSVLLVYLTWNTLGWKVLFLVAGGFTLIGIGLLWYARTIVGSGKLSLPATMNELRNDRDALL